MANLNSQWPQMRLVTCQALTDLGRAPTFYDCLVEMEASAAPVATGAAA